MKPILLVKKLLGLVEMKSGLVNASFSLPEWQAVNEFLCTPERIEKIEDLNFPLHNLSIKFKTAIWNAKIRIKIQ